MLAVLNWMLPNKRQSTILQVEFHMLTIILYSLKNASPQKQEAARIEVENAEDDLVQKTEVAITLMKTVLDNVRQSY